MEKTLRLTIDKVIKNGLGLGRLADGRVVMVPRALAGEEVLIAPKKKHSHYLEAELVEILAPSPQRVSSACPAYEECGGCDLQHAAYPEQLRIKNEILAETLVRAGLASAGGVRELLGPPLASPRESGYRQRIRLHVRDGVAGYYARESHRLIPIRSCPLAGEASNRLLAELARNPHLLKLLAQSTGVELQENPEEKTVLLLLHQRRKERAADRQAAQALSAELPLLAGVVFSVEGQAVGPCFGAGGEKSLGDLRMAFSLPAELCGRPLRLALEPGGFCQVNLGQNENCIRLLLEWTGDLLPCRVLDLYCGMGNFSLPLAARGCRVTGLDQQRSTIRSALLNAEQAGLGERCSFSREGAAQAVARLDAAGEHFDLILLDPPRSGCVGLIPLLAGLGASRLVYISCDPSTLARDLAGLVAGGYRLAEARMVDMFPQTAHLESMVRLERG